MKKTITNKARYLGLKLTAIIFVLLLFASGQSYGQLLQWNTFGNVGTETTEPSTFNDANIAAVNLTQGTITAATNGNRFGGSGWFNTGNTVAGNTLAEAIAGNDYIQFVVTPNSGFSFTPTSFYFSWQSSSSGPKTVTLRSSADSYAADLGSTTVTASIATYTITISGLTNITTATTFRLYGYGATATTGTGGFDVASSVVNVQLNGTTASTGNTAPTVTTQTPTSIGTQTATGNGNITATGGVNPTVRGFCWDLQANADPDIADAKVEETGTFSTGAFTGSISSLTAGTQYKVRAFATNSVGTSYGAVQTFYTLSTEPTNHAATFTATANSQTSITTNWLDNDGSQAASGFLVMANTTGTFTDPVDGTTQTDDANLNDNVAVINVAHATQTYVWNTGLNAGTTYYFKIYPYNGTGNSINYKTNLIVPTSNATTDAPLNTTSVVEAPATQISAGNVASTVTASGSAVDVFKFKISDLGPDVAATKVTQVKIKKSSSTADWTDHIAGAQLWDGGSQITTGTVVITDADITFPITSGNLDIAAGSNKEITLKIWLNTTNIVDNSTMVFTVSQNSHGFTADAIGSTFATDFGAAVTGNTMTVTVDAIKLAFVQQPTNVGISANISPSVTVSANDANNNRDLDYVSNVAISATGLTGSPVSVTPVSGLATFSTLSFSSAAIGITLDASSGSLTGATSSSFDILLLPAAGEIVINQISPDYSGASDEYIELVNRTNKTFDLSQLKIEYQSSGGSGGGAGGNLTGSLGPYQFWILSPNATITVGQTTSLARDGSITAGFAGSAGQLALRLKNSPNTIIDGIAYGTVSPNNLGEGTSTSSPPADGGLKRVSDGIDNNTNSTDFTTVTQANIYLRNSNSLCIASTYTLPATSYSADVVISGSTPAVTLSGNTTIAGKVTVLSGGLTVASSQTLTVTGTLTNSAGSTGLVLKSDATGTASLIHSTAGVSATVENYIALDDKWHFLSTPITSQTIIGNFSPSTCDQTFDFFKWDETANMTSGSPWINLRATANSYNGGFETAFAVGRGYLVAYSSGYSGSENKFTGNLNNGDQTITVTKDLNTFNLIGNPFASAIDWDASGYTNRDNTILENAEPSIWSWNGTSGNYGTYKKNVTGTNGVSNVIAPHQGFFVQAKAAGSFTIPNTARVHSNSNILKSTPSDLLRLKVTTTANSYSDEVIVNFNSNATANEGVAKWFSMLASAPSLYSVKNSKNYTINTLTAINNNLLVPVSFIAGVNGNYSIKATELNSFASTTTILLEDLKTNTTQNLMQNPVYNFTAATTDNANRFVLHFATSLGVNEIGNTNSGIYAYDNNIYVNNSEKVKQINVYNTLGQLIKTVSNVNGLQKINMNGNVTGYYIVKVITDKNVYSEKVLVK